MIFSLTGFGRHIWRMECKLICHVLCFVGVFVLLLSGCGALPHCHIAIDPPMVVVRYGDPVSVNCTATRTTRGMGWEATVGSTGMQPNSTQSLLWNVSSLTDWTAEPKCYANFQTEPKQCEKKLKVTLYKYPDRVSVSSNTSVMDAGRPYRLQCDVQSIAPVQYLSVNWYRGGALIHTENISEDTTRTPVNVSPTLLITPSCTDDGVQYTCEAELRLGPDGPQPNQSEPLNITIHPQCREVYIAIVAPVFFMNILIIIICMVIRKKKVTFWCWSGRGIDTPTSRGPKTL